MKNEAWSSQRVRETFLSFFESKQHRKLSSFPLIPANDPTLLFTAAGMAPFKAEFAGIAKPVAPRITTCQKCLRADDIEKVGHTARHHTFFEMLGNFSFGDYFKEEAIVWAWELLTQHYKLPSEKLWVSVHTDDDEAYILWQEKIKLPKEKLFRLSDNFWGPIGQTGTCGPDSEIYYDRGLLYSCGKPDCRPGCENTSDTGVPCDRFLELWNLVFTMYHKDENGKLHELPKKNIDTGAGLERITMILQEKNSPFETDLFSNVIQVINPGYEKSSPKIQSATRIIADHIRAVTFVLAEGVTPSNEGRGYVLQKILRRAFLNHLEIPKSPSLDKVAESVIQEMQNVYPDLSSKKEQIIFYINQGKEEFDKILDLGNELVLNELKTQTGKTVSGQLLFRFHDERGFPFEFAKEFLKTKGYEVDEAAFHAEMEKQRERSRTTTQTLTGQSFIVNPSFPPTRFLGYQQTESSANVLEIVKDQKPVPSLSAGEKGIVILDQTPFYAESGGQVGDTGIILWKDGEAEVLDTQKNEGGTFFHSIQVREGNLTPHIKVEAKVDHARRAQIRKHHTATHLLHAALREVLGPHVQQAGSYVCDQYLRLDFSNPKAASQSELLKIEALVNEKTSQNLKVDTQVTNQEEARKLGALAFFGEKYGEEVRVVVVNQFSKELCGGTHASATGDLGPFVILKESSIAKGIRRIEAKVGHAAIEYLQTLQQLKFSLTDRLKVDLQEVIPQLDLILDERKNLQKENLSLKQELAPYKTEKKQEVAIADVALVWLKSVGNRPTLKKTLDDLKNKEKSKIFFMTSTEGENINVVVGVTGDLVDKGYSASNYAKAAASVLGGGGGGRNDLAEAGGKDGSKLGDAFAAVKEALEKQSSIMKS